MKNSNVADISESGLCCSCGACAWVCPKKAISYVETVGGYLLPKIDLAKCSHCGICASLCPGAGFEPAVANRLSSDPFTGIALQSYVGKATNERLYANSQSGGIVSALLVNALETGEIAGAITTVMVAGNPPRTQARFVQNIEEIQQAQKSKYCPVPLLSILDEIEKLEKPVALVGTGCHIHGLNNLRERFPHLKGKIAFTIGLICDRTMTSGAIDYLLKRANINSEVSKVLHFRDKTVGGYPGNVNIICSSGVSTSLLANERIRIKDFFTPARCRICFDKMNMFADITVGDPWGIDGIDRIGGESVAVIRTETGRYVFQKAIADKALTVREIEYQHVLTGQGIEKKRIEWREYVEAWKNLGRPLPNFYKQVSQFSAKKFNKGIYRKHIQQALSLDHYPSRETIVTTAEKKLLFQSMKKKNVLYLRAMIRMIKRISKIIVKGHR